MGAFFYLCFIMALTKSLGNDIEVLAANGLSVFVDDVDSTLKVKDTNGNIEPLSNYLGADLVENIGTGVEIYKEGTSNPSQLRTLVQGANVSLTQNSNSITIDAANVTGTALYYGSFISTLTQTTTGNEQKAMTLNTTLLSNGISIQNNSRIQVANAGIYNLQFSAQITKTQGGSNETIYVYLRKNGTNVSDSNTAVTLANNNQFIVLAWNFVESLSANQYLELMWYATDQHIQISKITSPIGVIPDIPSLIVTMNRVG